MTDVTATCPTCGGTFPRGGSCRSCGSATPSNAELVAMAGKALWGVDWQAPLSRRLNVQLRTVQRVAAAATAGEEYPAAKAWLDDLALELAAGQVRLRAVAELIKRTRAA